MEGGSIQLPFGYIPDEKADDGLQFNLPLNFRKDILFDKLPHIVHLNNPAIDNVVKGGKVDDLALQKYLLAMGLMQDTIQENLNMVVTDGSFNNASICRTLDTKYPSVMKKSNPIDAVFKDKAKFDVQNPVVGSLVVQAQENKAREREYMKQLSKAPSITDTNIGKRLKELKEFNEGRVDEGGNRSNNDSDDDDAPGVPPTPPAPYQSYQRMPGDLFPMSPYTPGDDDCGEAGNSNLTPTQRFLLQQPQTERVAEAVQDNRVIPRHVPFPKKLIEFS